MVKIIIYFDRIYCNYTYKDNSKNNLINKVYDDIKWGIDNLSNKSYVSNE